MPQQMKFAEILNVAGVASIPELQRKMRIYDVDMTSDLDTKLRTALEVLLLNPFPEDVPPTDRQLNASLAGAVGSFCLATAAPWRSFGKEVKAMFAKDTEKPCAQVCANLCRFLFSTIPKWHHLFEYQDVVATFETMVPHCINHEEHHVVLAAFELVEVGLVHVARTGATFYPSEILTSLVDRLVKVAATDDYDSLGTLCSIMGNIVKDWPQFYLEKHVGEAKNEDLFDVLTKLTKKLIEENKIAPECLSYLMLTNTSLLQAIDVKLILKLKKGLRELLLDTFALAAEIKVPEQMSDNVWLVTYVERENVMSLNDAGMAALSELSTTIEDDKKLLKLFEDRVVRNANSPEPHLRRAAVGMILHFAEGQTKALAKTGKQTDLIKTLLVLSKDSNMRVQAEALLALSELAANNFTHLTPECHKEIVDECLKIMEDPTTVPHVRCDALFPIRMVFEETITARSNLEAEMGEEKYKTFLPTLNSQALVLQDLRHSLSVIGEQAHDCPHPFFKRDAMQTIGCIITAAHGLIAPFLDDLIPLCHMMLTFTLPEDYIAAQTATFTEVEDKDRLKKLAVEDVQKLHGYAIEATTQLAMVVGYSGFSEYAEGVMEYIVGEASKEYASVADEYLAYILRAWTCMVECMGARAAKYADQVMPKLLQLANYPCDVEISTLEPGEEMPHNTEEFRYTPYHQGHSLKIAKVSIAASAAKDIGWSIIMQTCRLIGKQLAAWIPAIATIALENMKFKSLETIRSAATMTLGVIAEVLAEAPLPELPLSDFIQAAFQRILEEFQREQHPECLVVLTSTSETLFKLAPTTGANKIANLDKIHSILDPLMQAVNRELEREDSDEEGEEDEFDDEEELDDDNDALPSKRERRE